MGTDCQRLFDGQRQLASLKTYDGYFNRLTLTGQPYERLRFLQLDIRRQVHHDTSIFDKINRCVNLETLVMASYETNNKLIQLTNLKVLKWRSIYRYDGDINSKKAAYVKFWKELLVRLGPKLECLHIDDSAYYGVFTDLACLVVDHCVNIKAFNYADTFGLTSVSDLGLELKDVLLVSRGVKVNQGDPRLLYIVDVIDYM